MVAVIEVVVVVVKVLMWDTPIIDMVVVVEVMVIDVLVDVEIIVVGFTVIVLKLTLSALYSVDVPSDVAVELFMDALTCAIIVFLTEIGVEVLPDVSANAFAVIITALEFPVLAPLEKFRRGAAFDCRPLALLGRASVLQAWMPSYHV